MTNHPHPKPTDDEFRKAAKVLDAAKVSEDILGATPDKSGEWLDNILVTYARATYARDIMIRSVNKWIGITPEFVAKTAILAHIQAEVLAGRRIIMKPNDLILRQDGDQWMCVKGDFENLQESESWWGDTPEMALIAYTTRNSTTNEEEGE